MAWAFVDTFSAVPSSLIRRTGLARRWAAVSPQRIPCSHPHPAFPNIRTCTDRLHHLRIYRGTLTLNVLLRLHTKELYTTTATACSSSTKSGSASSSSSPPLLYQVGARMVRNSAGLQRCQEKLRSSGVEPCVCHKRRSWPILPRRAAHGGPEEGSQPCRDVAGQ